MKGEPTANARGLTFTTKSYECVARKVNNRW